MERKNKNHNKTTHFLKKTGEYVCRQNQDNDMDKVRHSKQTNGAEKHRIPKTMSKATVCATGRAMEEKVQI